MLVVSKAELIDILEDFIHDMRMIDDLSDREFAEGMITILGDCRVLKTMQEDLVSGKK